MKCWTISYYFRHGPHKKRLYRGQFCGCMPGQTREDAIKRVLPIELEDGDTLVRVCAKPSPKKHFCFTRQANSQGEERES